LRKPPFVALALAAALALTGSACDETTGPDFGPVPEEPTEVTVFGFERSSVRDPSAFDATVPSTARPDQTAEWDFLVDVPQEGPAELRPRNAVIGDDSDAGLQTSDRAFGEIDRAPEGGYTTDAPVTVDEGDVVVGRSRQDPSFSLNCSHFFKLEVVSVDRDAGTLTFRHLVNPACEERNLVPGSSNRD
jgi:hypothetical protein